MGRFELKRGLEFSTRTGVSTVISSRSKTSFCHLAENCLVIDALSGCGGCLLAAGHQIYRTRSNPAFCQRHGIRLSGPRLGRPTKE
jgi:hypothetical protein